MRLLLACLLILALSGCTSVEGWIAVYFPDEHEREEALDVAWCESRHQWEARSSDGANHGLFQINVVHRPTFERVTGRPWSEHIYGPQNVHFARWLYEQQGWRPWACAP